MNRKAVKGVVVLFLLVILSSFVSADFLGMGEAWSSVKGVAKGWDPGYTGVIGLIFVFIVMFFVARRIGKKHGVGRVRSVVGGRSLGRKAGRAGGLLGKKPSQTVHNGGRKEVGVLRNLKAKRAGERQMEDRMEAVEKQIDADEEYIVMQLFNLENNIMDKEMQINNLAQIQEKMVGRVRVLDGEFYNTIKYLQANKGNQELINRAVEIRERIRNVLRRIIQIARVMKQKIKEQEAIEQKALDEEEQLGGLEEKEKRIEKQEVEVIKKEGTVDEKTEDIEDKPEAKETKAAEGKDKKRKAVVIRGVKFGKKEQKVTRKAKGRTKKQIELDKKREEALDKIGRVAAALIQTPNMPVKYMKDNIGDINDAMGVLLPRKNVVFKEAEHINKLYEKVMELRKKKIKMRTKREHLRKLADKLFAEAEKEEERYAMAA